MTLVRFKNGEDKSSGRAFSPFNDVFDGFFGGSLAHASMTRVPAANVLESANGYAIEIAAPGMQKEDFKISLEKDMLSISAEKKSENNEDSPKFTRREFSYSSFKRSFNLPEVADKENIKAEYSNGILTLTIDKKKEAVDVIKEIKIS